MAVAAASIQALRDETGSAAADMATYGYYWFGRPGCNLGEFVGKSGGKSYTWSGSHLWAYSFWVPDIGNASVRIGPAGETPGGGGGGGAGEGSTNGGALGQGLF